MRLKLRTLKWEAGRPVAILNIKTADKASINPDERIIISKDRKSVIAVVDTASKILGAKEIILSKEAIKILHLKKGDIVNIEIAEKPEVIG